jgi:hypothetical protein
VFLFIGENIAACQGFGATELCGTGKQLDDNYDNLKFIGHRQ